MVESYTQAHNVSLIIQPGDSFFPLVDSIDRATESIKMTVFRMDDPIVKDALKSAVTRGVAVQALVAIDSKGWVKRNKKLSDELTSLGVDVKAQRAEKKIKRYHYKILIVDNHLSLILTFNPTQKNLHYARDFGVLIKDSAIATELTRLFDADWQGEKFKPDLSPLVISPHNTRERIMELLRSAQYSIRILDAKVEDQQALGVLIKQAAAGVDVKIISRDRDYNHILPGFHVRKLARYKLHAKCIVVDGHRFFVGSQNLREVSMDHRREVGIIIEDHVIAQKIERIFDEDWTNATERLDPAILEKLGKF
jgi:phosphatidylserine/phosphatidylglycerophosphate/cardiolipin synthase-like enzyme